MYAALGYEMFSGPSSLLSFLPMPQPFSPAGGARPQVPFALLLHLCLGGRDGGLRGFEGQIYLEALPSLSLAHQARYEEGRLHCGAGVLGLHRVVLAGIQGPL